MSLLDQMEADVAAIVKNTDEFAEEVTIGAGPETITGLWNDPNGDVTIGSADFNLSKPSFEALAVDISAAGLERGNTLTRPRTGMTCLIDAIGEPQVDGTQLITLSEV